jgi:AcrR family transcriptional regulator
VTELRGYAKGRERREEILAAADAAFAKHGFRGASLAQRVGLSQPGLLHHFPSKEDLLLEVLRLRHERYRGLRERAASRFLTEQREGRLATDVDPETLAVQVLALFDGLELQWLLEPDAVDMVDVLRDFLARLD